jgi:glutaredoxin
MDPERLAPQMPKVVTVISKKGCHLCEKVEEALRLLSSKHAFELEVLDINDDPKLHDAYWLTIPAVLIDGKDVFDARHMSPGLDYQKKLEELLIPAS